MAREARAEKGDPPDIDRKARTARLSKAIGHQPFPIELNEKNAFQLRSNKIDRFSPDALTRIVDDEGATIRYEAKGARCLKRIPSD